MRSQPLGAVGHGDHAPYILLNPTTINQQRGRGDLCSVGNLEPIRLLHARAHLSAKTTSISTGMFLGNELVPTALRAPTPFSCPQISANNSLQPLITEGWS